MGSARFSQIRLLGPQETFEKNYSRACNWGRPCVLTLLPPQLLLYRLITCSRFHSIVWGFLICASQCCWHVSWVFPMEKVVISNRSTTTFGRPKSVKVNAFYYQVDVQATEDDANEGCNNAGRPAIDKTPHLGSRACKLNQRNDCKNKGERKDHLTEDK